MSENTNPPNYAQDLVRIHKAITRGLSVGIQRGEEYRQVGFPNAEERQGYIHYIQSLAIVLEAHHLGEDEVAFPMLMKALPSAPYERLSQDHQEIAGLLVLLKSAVACVVDDSEGDNLAQLVEVLRRTESVWTPHIRMEEEHFSQETLGMVMESEAQRQVSSAMAKHGQEHSVPPSLVLPFVVFNLQAEDRVLMAATLPSVVWEELIPKAWKEQWLPMKPFLLD